MLRFRFETAAQKTSILIVGARLAPSRWRHSGFIEVPILFIFLLQIGIGSKSGSDFGRHQHCFMPVLSQQTRLGANTAQGDLRRPSLTQISIRPLHNSLDNTRTRGLCSDLLMEASRSTQNDIEPSSQRPNFVIFVLYEYIINILGYFLFDINPSRQTRSCIG